MSLLSFSGDMAAGVKKRVLVVEDDDPIAALIKDIMFAEFGCETISAEDGNQALAIARGEKVDLIILDYLLPELDGLQAYDALQADPSTRDIPVLFVTAAMQHKDFMARNIEHVIAKPFELDEFLSEVGALLYPDRGR